VQRTLGALVAILAGGILVMATLGLFGPSEAPRGTPAPTRTPRPSASATGATTASAPRTITLTLTEQDLTKAAQSYMPLTVGGITVTDPRVRLEPGRLTLTATGRAFIVNGPIVVVASPVVADGRAAAKVESATFAGFSVPESTKADIAETFTRTLTQGIPRGARVISVTVNAGTLVVEALPA
jgi:hypothetical protein